MENIPNGAFVKRASGEADVWTNGPVLLGRLDSFPQFKNWSRLTVLAHKDARMIGVSVPVPLIGRKGAPLFKPIDPADLRTWQAESCALLQKIEEQHEKESDA